MNVHENVIIRVLGRLTVHNIPRTIPHMIYLCIRVYTKGFRYSQETFWDRLYIPGQSLVVPSDFLDFAFSRYVSESSDSAITKWDLSTWYQWKDASISFQMRLKYISFLSQVVIAKTLPLPLRKIDWKEKKRLSILLFCECLPIFEKFCINHLYLWMISCTNLSQKMFSKSVFVAKIKKNGGFFIF